MIALRVVTMMDGSEEAIVAEVIKLARMVTKLYILTTKKTNRMMVRKMLLIC